MVQQDNPRTQAVALRGSGGLHSAHQLSPFLRELTKDFDGTCNLCSLPPSYRTRSFLWLRAPNTLENILKTVLVG